MEVEKAKDLRENSTFERMKKLSSGSISRCDYKDMISCS